MKPTRRRADPGCGPKAAAMRKILERAYYDFRELQYRRLAELSVAQMRLRTPACTGCEKAARTGSDGLPISPLGRPRWPSASGVDQSRTDGQVTCGWIQFIRGISMESKALKRRR